MKNVHMHKFRAENSAFIDLGMSRIYTCPRAKAEAINNETEGLYEEREIKKMETDER